MSTEPAISNVAWQEAAQRRALSRRNKRSAAPPHVLRAAIAVAVVAHLLLCYWLYGAMLPPSVDAAESIQVDFVAAPALEPPLPEPPLMQRASAPVYSRKATATGRELAAPLPVTEPKPLSDRSQASTSHLFNEDGSIRLPPAIKPAQQEIDMQRSRELMARGHNLLHCRQSRYAGGFKADENMGDEIARKYLVWIGRYNPHSAMILANRQAAAAADCDDPLARSNEPGTASSSSRPDDSH